MPRPRRLPESEALDLALRVYWDKGYDRASLGDLGEALGVGPSSIYNAFGSKAELFRRSLDHYVATQVAFVGTIVEESAGQDARAALSKLLDSAVGLYTDDATPMGCAIMQGGGGGGSRDSEGGEIAALYRSRLQAAILTILKTTKSSDDLSAPASLLAKFLLVTMQGLSQLACDGATKKQLQGIAKHALESCFVSSD